MVIVLSEEKHNPEDVCAICNGVRFINMRLCPYCNGTGEWNKVADSYYKNHICQCIVFDRETCPVCNKKCHHDSGQTPKQKIDPGWGGTTAVDPDMNADDTPAEVKVIDA